ncbi:MAG: DUF6489 family protein [Alphaproteobacteria bacterium]
MKISIDIDCTPSEARRFFGLPDLEPLQTEVMEVLKDRMLRSLDAMDPEALARSWFTAGSQGMEQFQKFMQGMMRGGGEPGGGKPAG